MRAGDVEDEDSLLFRNLDDLEARGVEETGSTGRLAADQWRIQVGARLAIIIESACPRLERDVRRTRCAAKTRANLPIAFLILRRAQPQSSFLSVERHRARD